MIEAIGDYNIRVGDTVKNVDIGLEQVAKFNRQWAVAAHYLRNGTVTTRYMDEYGYWTSTCEKSWDTKQEARLHFLRSLSVIAEDGEMRIKPGDDDGKLPRIAQSRLGYLPNFKLTALCDVTVVPTELLHRLENYVAELESIIAGGDNA